MLLYGSKTVSDVWSLGAITYWNFISIQNKKTERIKKDIIGTQMLSYVLFIFYTRESITGDHSLTEYGV